MGRSNERAPRWGALVSLGAALAAQSDIRQSAKHSSGLFGSKTSTIRQLNTFVTANFTVQSQIACANFSSASAVRLGRLVRPNSPWTITMISSPRPWSNRSLGANVVTTSGVIPIAGTEEAASGNFRMSSFLSSSLFCRSAGIP